MGLLLPVHAAEQPTRELSALSAAQHLPAGSTLGIWTGNLYVPQDNRGAGSQQPPLLL